VNPGDFDPRAMKILVVDDTTPNIDVLRQTLQPAGYQLAIAQSGEKALAVAPRFEPDLILLDVMMPGIDGIETCARLKQLPGLRDVPVIFITAKTETEDIVRGFVAGGVDYIAKPIRQDEVLARVRTHMRMRAMVKALVLLDQQKNRFLGICAHDLRSPLSALIGTAELILECGDEMPAVEARDYVQKMRDTGRHMLNLVNDLLDFAAIARGSIALRKAPLDPNSVVRDRIEIARHAASRKHLKIEASAQSTPAIEADRTRIAQVVDNLLGNAIKFSPENTTIRVTVEPAGDAVALRIADEGPGISAEEQQRMFAEFQQLSAKPTHGEKSTGLGLAIVRRLVDAHGGKITVDSIVGKGTTFSVLLPVATP
jgi:signal transduction histidine kinase